MKTCSVTGCNNPVWGKGVCAKHAPKTPLKKTAWNITCVNDSLPLYITLRDEFFMSIWRKRRHVCEHCGKYLGKEPLSYMFDHILEKNKYPDLKYEEENIWLTCLECHDNKNRGMISEKYQEKINFVITKFNVS